MTLAGTRLWAQSLPLRGTIDGIVTDSAIAPLEGAVARILGTGTEVRTGAKGRFRISGLLPAARVGFVRRLGYDPISATVTVSAGDTVRSAFELSEVARVLTAMTATSLPPLDPLAEFEGRRLSRIGQFRTEEEIKRLNFVGTASLLRTLQSVRVLSSSVTNARGFNGKPCALRIFVDGAPFAVRDIEADLPPPSQLAGIEVHAKSATVPMRYATFGGVNMASGGGGVCGVVLLWTKR